MNIIINNKISSKWLRYLAIIIVLSIVSACAHDSRPQNPKHRPYNFKEVSFKSKNQKVKLTGELTYPKGAGVFPAVILITGSGPQDRDETVLGHKPFLVISDYLTRQGFAVLRYDDRGVGKSSGDFFSADLYDFADDASGAYSWLEQQQNIDKKKIGFLGHSEGGVIAPQAALRNPARFMILLASPAKPLFPDLIMKQREDLLHAQGASEEIIKKSKTEVMVLTNIVKKSQSLEEAKTLVSNWLKSKKSSDSKIKYAVKLYASRWGITYAKYDPTIPLKSFKQPVLALFGGKDLQVSAFENAPIMKKILSNKNSQVRIFPYKNHLFQNTKTGKLSEYQKIKITIEPVVLETITSWLKMILKMNKKSKLHAVQNKS